MGLHHTHLHLYKRKSESGLVDFHQKPVNESKLRSLELSRGILSRMSGDSLRQPLDPNRTMGLEDEQRLQRMLGIGGHRIVAVLMTCVLPLNVM